VFKIFVTFGNVRGENTVEMFRFSVNGITVLMGSLAQELIC
jgi:hypothetical protein